jgi:hypothetical protein
VALFPARLSLFTRQVISAHLWVESLMSIRLDSLLSILPVKCSSHRRLRATTSQSQHHTNCILALLMSIHQIVVLIHNGSPFGVELHLVFTPVFGGTLSPGSWCHRAVSIAGCFCVIHYVSPLFGWGRVQHGYLIRHAALSITIF